jgi:hypothetical protein
MKDLEARQTALQVVVASLHPVPPARVEVVEDRLAEWRRLCAKWMPESEDIRPEDTMDRDYGALPEPVYGKGVSSPTGFAFDYQPAFQGIWVSDRPRFLIRAFPRSVLRLRAAQHGERTLRLNVRAGKDDRVDERHRRDV